MELDSNVLNAKCKNCGSELVYNPKMGCLTCKYCSTNVYLPKKNENIELVREYTSDFHLSQLNQSLVAYKCKGCGNVFYMSSEESSKKCPNCAMTACEVIEDSGYCADGVIPFKVSKEQAEDIFAKHLKSKGIVLDQKEAQLEGVFVPVWNFMFNVDSTYSASATELRRYSDGTYYSVSKPIYGEKHKRVKSHCVSATNAEKDEFLSLFDENDFVGILPYTPEYTYGYKVDRIDKDLHDFYFKVTENIEETTRKSISKSVYSSYKEVSGLSVVSRASNVFYNFTYVPVYINRYKRRRKEYVTYISGTTGKVADYNPPSAKKVISTIFKFLIAVAVIVFLILVFTSK